MKGGRFSPGQAYVAFSRVKTLQGLHILNFNSKAIKASSDVQNEMTRLNNNLLRPPPQMQFLSLPETYITVCLLNVRSLVAKLADIEQDLYLKAANVVCFCETWLTASQASPKVLDSHVIMRCDRETGDNKGGTIVYASGDIYAKYTCSFTSLAIEVACSTLTLVNATQLQLLVLYRSPGISLQALTTMLNRILDYISSTDKPVLILGDFNDDILSQHTSIIVSLMSDHGFSQLVTKPTTAKGTLIDHVYYNRPTNDIVVEVRDTYYSDHDTIYCSVPLTL